MFLFRRISTPQSAASVNLEGLLRQTAPDWWQTLPDDLRGTILQDKPAPLLNARSPRHVLWSTGDALYHHAEKSLQAAEACARQALVVPGDAIDEMLAYTVLIRVYAARPDDIQHCIETCYQALERAGQFRAAWQERAEEQGIAPEDIVFPRLEAFDRLIAIYEQRGDIDAAYDICQKAVTAGYPEYGGRVRLMRWRYLGENAGSFLRGMLAFGATTAMLELNAARSPDLDVPLLYPFGTLMLWVITLALIFPWPVRELLLNISRRIRRRPILFWLLLLVFVVGIPVHAQLEEFNPLFQSYDTWMLLWGGSLLLFAGLTVREVRAMGHRLSTSRLSGVMVTLTTIAILMFIGELVLRYGPAFSNSYARGLLYKRWEKAYWQPLNYIGYRDYDPVLEPPPGVQRILVVGDSFAAGFGLRSIEEGFPRLLANRMGDNYRVNIAAQPGWSTRNEIEGMEKYLYTPDILIWSYFLNDIAEDDPFQSQNFAQLFPDPPPVIQPYVEKFYLGEFLYWNVYRQILGGGDSGYGDLIRGAYARPDSWNSHLFDLETVIDYCDKHGIKLVVIIWPVLTGVEQSEPMTRQVEAVFTEKRVPVVNMVDYLKGYSGSELVVSPLDMHPGDLAQKLAADALFNVLTGNTPQPPPPGD